MNIFREAILKEFSISNDGDIADVCLSLIYFKGVVPTENHHKLEDELDKMVLEKLLTRNFENRNEDPSEFDYWYELTDNGINELLFVHGIKDSSSFFINKLQELIESINNSQLSEVRKKDYVLTWEEIMKCYSIKCFNATIALCGKVVEIYLTEVLGHFNIKIEQSQINNKTGKRYITNELALGQLFNLTHEIPNHEKYIYIKKQTIDLIRSYRNGSAHFSEKIPIPSMGETEGVVSLIVDIIERRLTYVW